MTDPGPLLALLPEGPVVSWVRNGRGLVGWGVARQWTAPAGLAGAQRFSAADQWWRQQLEQAETSDEVDQPGTGPIAFGSFSFAPDSAAGSTLLVPKVLIGHRRDIWWLTIISDQASSASSPGSTSAASQAGELNLAQLSNTAAIQAPGSVHFASDNPLAEDQWRRRVAQAVAHIRGGSLEKVVLARAIDAVAQAPIDPRWLLRHLAAEYPDCWSFAVDGLIGATPELLVRSERGLVQSRVLAGTIQRTGDAALDAALSRNLAGSAKDLAEHDFAVQSLAQALIPHCASMSVPPKPFILELANVLHLASDISAVLADPPGHNPAPSVLELVAALHPTAAVGGTPTAAATQLIAELEGLDRGRYAGPVGWIDSALQGEWGIALRCAELDANDPRRLRLFAGCGIVAESDPVAELAEAQAKLIPIRQALAGGARRSLHPVE